MREHVISTARRFTRGPWLETQRFATTATLVALLLLLLRGAPATGTTLTGDFLSCQQASENVITNGTTFTVDGVQYPVPDVLKPTSAFTFLRVPGTSLLVSQTGGGTSCVGSDGTAGHVLFLHDFPATPGANLVELRRSVCINEKVAQAGHCIYDRPSLFSSQRIVGVRERMPLTENNQRTLWIDLDSPAPDAWSLPTTGLATQTLYSPSGDAAAIEHDVDNSDNVSDWAVIDLCPGSVGNQLADVQNVPGTATPSVVQKPDGSFVVRLSNDSTVPEVTLPDCLGPPPPPPPTDARLTVTAVGPGNGVVQEIPNISCATDGNPNLCQADYTLGTVVTLYALARNRGAIFQGWSGDCSGTSTSTTVTMDADHGCTATFDEIRAEVSVTLGTAPEPATAGASFTATATVSNTGPDPALNVDLTFFPPTGTTVDLLQLPAGCAPQASGVILCHLGTLAPSASSAPAIVLDVDPFALGSVSTDASVATTTFESNTADNSASARSTLIVRADLSLVKSASPEPVEAGSVLVYRLEVTNAGPSASVGGVLTDSLPGFVTLRSVPGLTTPTYALGPLAPGRTMVGTVLVDVDAAATDGQILTNVASVAGFDPDPVASNDSSMVDSTVSVPTGNLVVPGPLGPFTLVADTSTGAPEGGTFSYFDFRPALDGNTVAFGGRDDTAVWGVYRWVGGRIVEVVRQGSTTPDGRKGYANFDFAGLSASGDDVAFLGLIAHDGGGYDSGLYYTGPCFVEPLADPATAGAFISVWGGQIQGAEAVVLASNTTPFYGILHTDGQTLNVIYDATTRTNGDLESLGVPAWDGTTVAFFRRFTPGAGTGGSYEEGILAYRAGTFYTVADLDTPVPGGPGNFTWFDLDVSVDGDLVAFEAEDGDGNPGVYVGNLVTGTVQVVANAQTTIPGTGSTFTAFHPSSSASVSAGRVAFVGGTILDPTAGGLYLWQDGTLQTVVTNPYPLPPFGAAYPLIGSHALSGNRLVFGNGLSVWVAELAGGPGAIFGDGFESGDDSAWSSTVP